MAEMPAEPREPHGSGNEGSGLAELWELRRWTPSRAAMVVVAGFSLVAGLLEALVIGLVAAVAAAVAQGQEAVSFSSGPIAFELSTWQALGIAAASTVSMTVLHLAASRTAARLLSTALVGLRTRLLSAYLRADYETQRRILPAELHDVLVFQCMRMSRAFMMVIRAVTAAFTFLALVTVAVAVDPLTAVAIILISGLLAVLFGPIMRRSKQAGGAHMDAQVQVGVELADMPGLLAESHVYGAADGLLQRASAPLDEAGRTFRVSAFLSGATPHLYLGAMLLMLLGGLAAIEGSGTTDFQTLAAIVLLAIRGLRYSQQVQSALRGAVELTPDIRSVSGRIRSLEAEAASAAGGDEVSHIDDVTFEGVTYFHEGTRDGIEDVSVTLGRGEIVGVVGHSGSGKTTFAEVLLRLRQPTAGRVLVNDRGREAIAPLAWFDRVAYVGQEPRLFAGSVSDNVAFFRSVEPSELARVLAAGALSADLDRWDRGADRDVGAAGRDVSGGQRQRIAIARALVGHPDILVMDEPTSAVDTDSDIKIREAISGLRGDTLVVVIAHRHSTLSVCDRILSFTDGRLTEVAPDLVGEVAVE